jgi:hypothetical protein
MLTLTLLPRRRGQYRLRLNLHAASLPLPRGPGSHRSLSAGSACSSPGATPCAGRLSVESTPLKLAGSLAGSLTASPANSPSPRGMLLSRHSKSAGCGGSVRSSLGAVKLDDGKGGGGSPRDSAVEEALEVIRAARGGSLKPQGAAGAPAAATGGRDECTGAVCDSSSGYDSSAVHGSLLDRAPLATAAVTADASFPSLLFTDAFCEGLPKQVCTEH